jgi:23S rRNA (cytosine1962-C5)-methyltransferase
MHASPTAVVSPRGAERWTRGHPWIYRSDVARPPQAPPGVVRVQDIRQRWLGQALWSPASEISLRLLDRDPDAQIDDAWWHRHIARALARRAPLEGAASAYRLVHGEGDGLPSLVSIATTAGSSCN